MRRIFAKRKNFFEAKSVGSFNASDSRQPGEFFIVKIKAGLVPAFVLTKIYKVEREPQGESLVLGSSANELRLEQFCDWTKSKKQNAELPFNASDSRQPRRSRHLQKISPLIGLIFLLKVVYVECFFP